MNTKTLACLQIIWICICDSNQHFHSFYSIHGLILLISREQFKWQPWFFALFIYKPSWHCKYQVIAFRISFIFCIIPSFKESFHALSRSHSWNKPPILVAASANSDGDETKKNISFVCVFVGDWSRRVMSSFLMKILDRDNFYPLCVSSPTELIFF